MTSPFSESPVDPFSSDPRQSPVVVLLFFLLAVLVGSLIGNACVLLLGEAWGIDPQSLILNLNEESPFSDRQFLRYANVVSHLMTFTLPAIATAVFFYRRGWADFLKIHKAPGATNLLLCLFLIVSSFGFAQFTYWINQQIPLPEWATQIEDSAANMIKGLLVMDGAGELLLNLLVMAVLPAVGEELLFRGVLQTKMERWTQQPHLAIWLTALIFSAFHLQFEGLIPRMVLGALLGYLFFWTRNLWVPIFGHFVFNGMQVLATFFYNGDLESIDFENVGHINWVSTLLSVICMAGISYILIQRNQRKDEQHVP
jgi:membrane protease YdiL (CAAX protease family)